MICVELGKTRRVEHSVLSGVERYIAWLASMTSSSSKMVHDLVISDIELQLTKCYQDPYYFLQFDKKTDPTQENNSFQTKADIQTFLAKFPPTFLSIDKEGRVLRIDRYSLRDTICSAPPADRINFSFSKVIVPGMRLGWITCSPLFASKLEFLTDSSTQHPHGMGQVFIAELLSGKGWGYHGFFKWISSLCDDYQRRRDLFLSVFHKELAGCPYASANKPSAGMFIWIKVHYEHYPGFVKTDAKTDAATAESLNMELFHKIFAAGVVVMPAQTFAIVNEGTKDAHPTAWDVSDELDKSINLLTLHRNSTSSEPRLREPMRTYRME